MGAACSKSAGAAVESPRPEDGAAVEAVAQAAVEAVVSVAGSETGHTAPVNYFSKRRGSVSAEPMGRSSIVPRRVVPKAEEARLRIKEIIKHTLLFNELDEDQQAGIIDAMSERKVEAGQVIIKEGEEGDNFYVIESGSYVANVAGEQRFEYEGKGSFGELALMYNCPRAATITAKGEGVLWALDRATFRSLVVGSMVERRQRHEATLRAMPIFQHLTHEQLAAVADCLSPETYQPGEVIIREAEELGSDAKFFIIESGCIECYRSFEGSKRLTKTLIAGDVFGEVALLTKQPRQADCVVKTPVKCLTMTRDAFERLMGPVEEILAKQISEYNRLNAEQGSPGAEAAALQGLGGPQPAAAGASDGAPARATSADTITVRVPSATGARAARPSAQQPRQRGEGRSPTRAWRGRS